MISGRIVLSLLAIVLVMILRATLHRDIGLKSLGVVGLSVLGMRQIWVELRDSGLPSWLRTWRILEVISFPTMSQ
jgi:hypothetical protein